MFDWIGRFHPLLVHLPIGIISLALLLKGLSFFKRWAYLSKVLPLILLIAFISSLGTSLTGYLLSLSGEYDTNLISKHQWAGIFLTLTSGLVFGLIQLHVSLWIQHVSWLFLAILMTLTGHWGGSITHGEDYLSFQSIQKKQRTPITDIQKALVYQDLIEPILEDKCYSCHSSKKQKGKLRLDGENRMLQGGEDGAILQANHPEKSLLYQRLVLSELEEEHMPPKGKPQLKETEIELIREWIKAGHPFDQKVHQIPTLAAMRSLLQTFVSLENKITESYVPEEEVEAANPEILEKIKKSTGALITPIAINSHYLTVNLPDHKKFKKTEFSLLEGLKAQIIRLKATETDLTDSLLSTIAKLENLTILHLKGCSLNDRGLQKLNALKKLKILNLTDTQITLEGLKHLATLRALKKIYLFGTKIKKSDWNQLKTIFPQAAIDTGAYYRQFLVLDSLHQKSVE